MKISEFTNVRVCPVCYKTLECVVHFDMHYRHSLGFSIAYKMASKNLYVPVQELYTFQSQCEIRFPLSIEIKDKFTLPGCDTSVVFAWMALECTNGDFSRLSTEVAMSDKDHDIEIYDDVFSIGQIKIINAYLSNETVIHTAGKTITIPLIPLGKWPFEDKSKLLDKLNKILVLI